MNITVNINAPELVNAIEKLAVSLGGRDISATVETVQQPVQQSAPTQPHQIPTSTGTPPVQPQTHIPSQTVPTSTQVYTQDQLAVAATQFIDAGKVNELRTLLQQFGIQALTQLPKEQYGTFATALRQLGAKI